MGVGIAGSDCQEPYPAATVARMSGFATAGLKVSRNRWLRTTLSHSGSVGIIHEIFTEVPAVLLRIVVTEWEAPIREQAPSITACGAASMYRPARLIVVDQSYTLQLNAVRN